MEEKKAAAAVWFLCGRPRQTSPVEVVKSGHTTNGILTSQMSTTQLPPTREIELEALLKERDETIENLVVK